MKKLQISEEGQPPKKLASFYEDSKGGEASRVDATLRAERRAWRVAAAALVVAIATVGGLVALSPLKIAVPYVIYVDQTTGDTQVREAADVATINFTTVMDKYWVASYVTSRERYYWEFLQYDYDRTMVMSARVPAREYSLQFDGANALYKRLGRDQEYAIRIVSVGLSPRAHGGGGTAVVRFEKIFRRLDTDQPGTTGRYIATVEYEYHVSPISSERALIANPLGFTVTAYRVDTELMDALPTPRSSRMADKSTAGSAAALQADSLSSSAPPLPRSSGANDAWINGSRSASPTFAGSNAIDPSAGRANVRGVQ
jgi:type IV secretion system protein VirB8